MDLIGGNLDFLEWGDRMHPIIFHYANMQISINGVRGVRVQEV